VAYRIIIAFVIDMGMDPLDLKLFTAVTVIVALSMPRIKNAVVSKLGFAGKHIGNRNVLKSKKERTV